MNRRDLFKILPGMFIPASNIELNKEIKFLSFCPESTYVNLRQENFVKGVLTYLSLIKDKNNILTFRFEQNENGDISKMDGILNGVDIDILSINLELDVPPMDIKKYGGFEASKRVPIIDNCGWICKISYKEK